MNIAELLSQDPEAQAVVVGEEGRQSEEMELIASENYASKAIMAAMASVLGNRYSEGYPGARYYAGQEFTDQAERLAQERAKELFNAKFANVQPLSGSPANLATYLALSKPGDAAMGMELAAGGHLTHFSKPSVTSKIWRSIQFGIDPSTGLIDYEKIRDLALEHRPKLIVAGFSAYPRTIDWHVIQEIANEVSARTVADIAHIAGFVASGRFSNPLDHGFDAVTTTTHKTLRGPRGGLILTNDEATAKKIDRAVFPGIQGGPHMNSVMAKAIAFGEALQPAFREYADRTLANATTLAERLNEQGVKLVTGGTDNHIVLTNVRGSFDIGGKKAQDALELAGLSTNRNSIPNETGTPQDPSGIRLGTPAMTTRGFGADEFRQVADWFVTILKSPDDADLIKRIKDEVKDMCASYPLPS